VKYSRLS